ncbi:MAG: hypothetical protein QXG65_01940 [Thermoplasmata archaeon]
MAARTETIGSLEELQRVKDAEREWAERIAGARAEAEAILRRLREEADGRIGLARTAAHQLRESRVRDAQAAGDREAEAILAAGEAEADRIRSGKGKRPRDVADAIVAAVLDGFL